MAAIALASKLTTIGKVSNSLVKGAVKTAKLLPNSSTKDKKKNQEQQTNKSASNKSGALVRSPKQNNGIVLSGLSQNFQSFVEKKESNVDRNGEREILLSIQKKVVKIDKLLKDNNSILQKKSSLQRLNAEKESRSKKEESLEKKKGTPQKGKGKGSSVGMPSFLDGIKNFFLTVLAGWIFNKIVPLLPKLVPIFSAIGKGIDFALNLFGGLVSIFSKVLEAGINVYNTFTNTLGWILGFRTEEDLNKFKKTFNRLVDLTLLASLLILNYSGGLGDFSKRKGGNKTPDGKPSGREKITTSGGVEANRGPLGTIRDKFDELNPFRQKPKVTTSGGKSGGSGFFGGIKDKFDELNPLRKKPKVTTSGGRSAGPGIFEGIGDFFGSAKKKGSELVSNWKSSLKNG